jgi:hypothetical protein
MKYYNKAIFLICLLAFCSCRKTDRNVGKEMNVFQFTWGTPEQILIENNHYHSFKYLDTLSHQLKGDSLTPLEFLGRDQIIIKKLVPTSMEMVERDGITDFVITKAEFLPDTFTFAVKKYIGAHFMILFSKLSASRVFELKDTEGELEEINPGYQPKYEINGYSVGDIIDRNLVEIIYVDVFGSLKTEEAVLKGSEEVIFTILGNKYIEKIEKTNIGDQELAPLIRNIDRAFQQNHEYEEIINGSGDFQETIKGYYWNERDVVISLQKTEKNYEKEPENRWKLEYSNYIITNILQNYLDSTPENI